MHVDTCYPLKLQRPTPSRPCNKQVHLIILSTLSKQLEQSRSSLPLIPTGPTPRERKLSQDLYLSYFRVQPLGKGNHFMQEWFYSYFPLKNQKLGKGSSYSHLRIHDFFKEFLVMVFVICEIRKSWPCKSTYIYIVF